MKYGSRNSISVGQSHLIRQKRTRSKQQRGCDKEFHSLSLADWDRGNRSSGREPLLPGDPRRELHHNK